MRIGTLLDLAVGLHPDRVLVSGPGGGLTAEQIRTAAEALAAAVAGAPDGPLCFVGVNQPAGVVAFFAADMAGRAFAPLNYRADAELLRHFFATVGVGAVVVDERYAGEVAAAAPGVPLVRSDQLPVASGTVPLAAPSSGSVDDVALYVFTSGTTSRPKAVALRHRHLVSYVLDTVVPGGEAAEAATIVTAPLYHIATLSNVLGSVCAGRRLVLLPGFDAEQWLATVEAERVTHAFVVPTMLYRIVLALRERGATGPSCLRTVAYGGAPAAESLVLEALERFPQAEFVNAYGLSETSATVAVLDPGDHRAAAGSADPAVRRRLSSAGRPLDSVEVRIAADGEILVRGAQVSGEYAGGLTAVDADGWFHTGDAGRFEDGYLFVEGRLDDMIIRGGENISPREIEQALCALPGVVDAAVVGMPDAEWGEAVEAVIEADEGVDPEALRELARRHLPGFKVPRRIVRVPALPRNDMGKVPRRELRALLADPA